jgi:glucosamine-phosphate N-acetyltransferase
MFSVNNFKLRPLDPNDHKKGYCELLKQLTEVGNITEQMFLRRFVEIIENKCIKIMVVEDRAQQKIVATGTLVIEPKFIHQNSSLGHIEDVVVDKNYCKLGLGKTIITELLRQAKDAGCYKARLVCRDSVMGFYEKSGFVKSQTEMNKVL